MVNSNGFFEATTFEAINSVFDRTDENKSFSLLTPGRCSFRGVAETIIKLQKLLELRSQNDIELHVKEVKKRRNRKKTGDIEYKFSDLDTHKKEINEELKKEGYNDLEDMVFRIELTNSENAEIPDTK